MCVFQDRSADFSTGSSVGQKNRIFAKLVMGMYEVGSPLSVGVLCIDLLPPLSGIVGVYILYWRFQVRSLTVVHSLLWRKE